MRLSGVNDGDIVAVDVNGHRAFCVVTGRRIGYLDVDPISPSFTWRTIKARQVTAHYARRRG